MSRNERVYTYNPDYAVHPGEVLEETLGAKAMTQSELARRTGISTKTLSQIVNGKAPVTAGTAIQFERVLGVSAALWTNLDANYRLAVARQSVLRELEEYREWVKGFPYKELEKRGVVPVAGGAIEKAERLLTFFGVSNKEAWLTQYGSLRVAFRQSTAFKSSFEATTCWLRLAELHAMEKECAPFDERRFVAALRGIRASTLESAGEFGPYLQERCADSGVALVFVAELKSTHLSGAARWLSPSKAMVALSLRHRTDDHFWFSLFHEAGHLLHDSKKEVYFDDSGKSSDCADEEQANRFACDTLIPPDAYRRFVLSSSLSEDSVTEFANEIGIAAGIVVGRLQHDGLLRFNSALNHLKRSFELAED